MQLCGAGVLVTILVRIIVLLVAIDHIQGLLERKKWQKEEASVKVGEIVLIDEPTKRLLWPLGVVEEAIRGRDGLVRSYSIRTAKGVIKRPAQRVVSLEVVHGQGEQ